MTIEFTEMTQQQIDEFLHAPRHAVVATNRKDGAPQISPVWYLYDGGKIYISVFANSAKYRNLKRDPRVSICVDGCHPDGRSVTIYGTAELVRGEAELGDDIVFRIARRYMESDEQTREYLGSFESDADEALIVVTPTKTIATDYN